MQYLAARRPTSDMSKFHGYRVTYEQSFLYNQDQPYHRYLVTGPRLALELHFYEYKPGDWSGGVECHYRKPPAYMADQAPSHETCHAFDGNACWHDGTGLWASEYWIPMWQTMKHAHDEILVMLVEEAIKRDRLTFRSGGEE